MRGARERGREPLAHGHARAWDPRAGRSGPPPYVSPVVPGSPGACGHRTVTDGGPPSHRHPRSAAARSRGIVGNSRSQPNVNHRKESVMKQQWKKSVALAGFVLATLCASSAFADVRWKHVVGVITA